MMKKAIYMLLVAIAIISCNDDFLERYPIAEITPENSFKTEQDLKLYTNSFYNDLPSINDIVKSDNISDNVLNSEYDFPVILFNQATMMKVENEDFLSSVKRERVSPVAKSIMDYWIDREIIVISHGFGDFEARRPGEYEGRVKFSITSQGIVPQEE